MFSSGVDARYFFSTARTAAAFGFVSTHFAPFNIARVAAAAAFGLASTHLPLAMTSQQYSWLYRFVHDLVRNVSHFSFRRREQAADGLGIGDGVDFAFIQREAKLARRENPPAHILACIDSVRAQHPVGKNKRRRSHPRDADPAPAQVLDGMDVFPWSMTEPADTPCEFQP